MRNSTLAITLVCMFGAGIVHAADVTARVDIRTQQMSVTVGGVHAYTWPVSTALAPKFTPKGTYHPLWVNAHYFSHKYRLPMPYTVYYNKVGYAVHAVIPGEEKFLGRPASHGCVRLSLANAKLFFDLVRANGLRHTTIVIN